MARTAPLRYGEPACQNNARLLNVSNHWSDRGSRRRNSILRNRSFFSRWEEERAEREKNHKSDILAVLEQNILEPNQVHYNEPCIDSQKITWAESNELYDSCISHLMYKKYRCILDRLEQAKQFHDKKTKEVVGKIEDYRRHVREKLENFGYLHVLPLFSPLPATEEYLPNQPHFNMRCIVQDIYDNIMASKFPTKAHFEWHLETRRSPEAMILFSNSEVVSGDTDTLRELLDLILSLQNDVKLTSLVEEIGNLQNELVENEELKKFESDRLNLVKQLTYGRKDLKGHCTYCMSFLDAVKKRLCS